MTDPLPDLPRGRWVWIGEKGPELVNIGIGSNALDARWLRDGNVKRIAQELKKPDDDETLS